MPKQSLVLGCRVKPATLALLRAIAAREHRTLSRVAAELLERSLATGLTPRMQRLNPPILWPPTGTGTADSPMRVGCVDQFTGGLYAHMPGVTRISASRATAMTACDAIEAVFVPASCRDFH